MNDEQTQINTSDSAAPAAPASDMNATPAQQGASQGGRFNGPRQGGFSPRGPRQGGFQGGRGGARPGGKDGKPRREPRAKPEFDQKIIDIRRVTRVSSGGRRFSFAVTIVAGDKKGRVGVGTGKGGDTALAVEKAFRNARKNLITVNLTKTMSLAHEVSAKYSSARVEMMPAPGKGVAAGSSVRDVIVLAGIKDVVAKLRSGTKNKLNNARAAIKALEMVRKPRQQHNNTAAVAAK